MKKWPVRAILLLATTSLWGTINTRIEVIGFSQDGSYIAYQIFGYDNESAESFDMIQIVDVVANDFASPSFSSLSKARFSLDQHNIIRGNTGLLVYERTENDLRSNRLQEPRKTAEFTLSPSNSYTILLEEREVETDRCANLQNFGFKPRIFTLSLHDGRFSSILQQDRVLYDSRHCPYAYQIYRIYVYGDKIAVFLDNVSFVFGGNNIYKLIVTGKLDRGYDHTTAIPTYEPWIPSWVSALSKSDTLQRPITAPQTRGRTYNLHCPPGTRLSLRFFLDGNEIAAVTGACESGRVEDLLSTGPLAVGSYTSRLELYAVLPDGNEIYEEKEQTVPTCDTYGLGGRIIISGDGCLTIEEDSCAK